MLASVASDIGRIRETNEDAYCLCQLCIEERPLLLVVADGMGGYLDGEVASQLAIRQLRSYMEQYPGGRDDYLSWLVSAFQVANRAVFEAAGGSMGTTLTSALLVGNRLLLAHVGDSRAYLVHGNELRVLTSDHSLVGLMVKNGDLAEQEAMRHPQRHLLMRALGTESEVVVDTAEYRVEPGNMLILCTDGLTNLVSSQELLHIVMSEQQVAHALVELANERGGTDNVTVLAVTIDWVGEERS